MKKSKYTEVQVLKSLSSKNDCRIKNRIIVILNDYVFNLEKGIAEPNKNKKHDLGNSSLAKIDYLQKICGYNIAYTNNF